MAKIGSTFFGLFRISDETDFTDLVIGGILSNVLFVLAAVIGVIEFIWRPISCHVPAQFTDAWEQYAENYCRSSQTYYLPLHELPVDYENRKSTQLVYTTWFPIVLFVHALLLRLPRFVWLILSKFSTINLSSLVKAADAYPNLDSTARQASVKTAADYLHAHFSLRDPDDRRTKLATIKDYWQCVKHPFPIGLLSMAAVLTNLIYAVATTLMFVKFCHFFELKNSSNFGWNQVQDFYAGRELEEISIFPEVIMCDYEVRVLGNVHHFTIQCILPHNRFYNILVLVLWFAYYFAEALTWITFVHALFVTLLPWPRKWFVVRRLHRRRTLTSAVDNLYVQHVGLGNGFQVTRHSTPMPNSQQSGLSASPVELRQFLENHIRTDGYFILKYISRRGGDLFVYELINHLWRQFLNYGPSAASVYERSVEPSPSTRHRFLVDQTFINTPSSAEVARRLVPASIPSIPNASQQQQQPSVPIFKQESDNALEREESKRPLLSAPNEDKRYWEPIETIKM